MSQYFIKLNKHGATLINYYGETHPKEGEWVKFGQMLYQIDSVTHVVTNKSDDAAYVYPQPWLAQVECEVGRYFNEDDTKAEAKAK